MKWILIDEQIPEIGNPVLVWKNRHVGGYTPGVYIASYEKRGRDSYFFMIEDKETNHNNFRSINEFSHWMPLPDQPERLSEKTLE